MFTMLNRFRGTDSYWAKINGILLGVLLGVITKDYMVGILTASLYVLGESMGWGKWIGGIIKGTKKASMQEIEDYEGTKNGIHFMASYIFPETEDYQKYCITALAIRGLYWFGLTLMPIMLFGYIGVLNYLLISVLLGIGFPLSVIIAKKTTNLFEYSLGYFEMTGEWEHAEVWYGLMQDIAILYIIVSIY